jgi:hypothetical protein
METYGTYFLILSFMIYISKHHHHHYQGMSTEHSEVRLMLSALVPRVESCKNALGPQEVGGMFWLFILVLFCCICIFYYLYVDSHMPLTVLHFCVG